MNETKISTLHPAIRADATNFILEAQAIVPAIRITDAYRSIAEQNALYAKGRTTSGSIVTNAKGGSSYHNFGLAFDISSIENGKLNYELPWDTLSAIGTKYNFEWGGNFKSIVDKPHFQNTFVFSTSELLKRYNNGNTSNGYVNLY